MNFRIIGVCVLCCISAAANDAAGEWKRMNGPFGGTITGMAVSGSSIFALTQCGIYKSTNNGTTWAGANNGISINSYRAMNGVAVSGTSIYVNALYVLYRSTDGGASWTDLTTGIPSPRGFNYIYTLAAIGSRVFAGTDHGVYRSADGGSTWTAVNTGLPGTPLMRYIVLCDSTLIASTSTQGIFVSTNYGENWSPFNLQWPATTSISACVTVGSRTFIGTYEEGAGGGVYTITRNGTTFAAVRSATFQNSAVYQLAFAGTTLYAGAYNGVLKSIDNAGTWTLGNTGFPSWYPINGLVVAGTSLLAGSNAGPAVYRSIDNGAHWTETNAGMTGLITRGLAASSTKLYCATDVGLYASPLKDSSWMSVNYGGQNSQVSALSTSGDSIYAGGIGAVYLSSNNGLTWKKLTAGLPSGTITSARGMGPKVYITSYGGLFMSSDFGGTWNPLYATPGAWLDLFGIAGTTLITTGGSTTEVYRSIDNGVTWSPAVTGLPVSASVTTLDAFDGEFYLGVFYSGLYKSSDLGASWKLAALKGTSVYSLVRSGTALYAGTTGGVMMTMGKGNTWSPINEGLPNFEFCYITVRGTYLYAGTLSGVWMRPLFELASVAGVQPANGGTGVQTTTTLAWSALTDASLYRLQVSTTPNFSSVILDKPGIVTTSSTVTGLASFSTYYWRVNAVNDAGEVSAWSPVQTFTTLLPPPSTVMLVNPSDGWRCVTDSVRFTWRRGIPQVTSYEIELEGDTTMTRTVTDTTVVLSVKGGKLERTLFWRVRAHNQAGTSDFSTSWSIVRLATSVTPSGVLPAEFALHNNYPNPFNPSTTFAFALPEKSRISLQIYDAYGRAIAILVSGELPAGEYTRHWDASGLPTGVYFYRMQAGTHTFTKRLLMLK